MSDRLEEIKHKQKTPSTDADGYYMDINEEDVKWLISELEESRAEVAQLEKRDKQVEIAILATRQQRDDEFNRAEKYKIELEKSKAENAELQAVFDLQATRTKKAEKMWKEATGKHSTLPDLGVLLDWLMGEIEDCKGASSAKGACMKAALNQLSKARAEIDHLSIAIGGVGERFEFQRRHRKWALKKARSYLHNPCATVVYAGGEGRMRVVEDKE